MSRAENRDAAVIPQPNELPEVQVSKRVKLRLAALTTFAFVLLSCLVAYKLAFGFYRVRAFFDDPLSLGPDSPVFLGQAQIGVVERVVLQSAAGDNQAGEKVEVILRLRNAYRESVRRGSVGCIEISSLLGPAEIRIEGGEGEPLREGETLQTRELPKVELSPEGQALVEEIRKIVRQGIGLESPQSPK